MADKLRTIIVEDEELARNLMKSFLAGNDKIEIVAECENGFEGVKMINELKPDLVFLDIQMPKITGFEMLELLDHKPQIVFATAYDQFAIKAFEHNAADYLLKPYSRERLIEAITKVNERIQKEGPTSEVAERIMNYPREGFIDRVVVKDRHKIHIIPVDKIKYIESMDDYVMIYTNEGRHIKQKTMKYFENHLNENNFIRIHRSYIINVDFIQHLEQTGKESYQIILKNSKQLPVSKTGLAKLRNTL